MTVGVEGRKRWFALVVLCSGYLMIVLDATIVNVALPSIGADLEISDASLAWIVNAYLLTFGGFLLLGGRLGDLFGQRKLFLLGIALFTAASLACGLANSQGLLVGARAVQGLGGAIVAAVALSLIMILFTEAGDRAKAMGVFGFVAAGGGTVGVVAGGLLTDTLNWHWIFLVNLPIGGIELRVRSPLVPLGLFKLRNLATANIVAPLTAAAMFAWFFLAALYLQHVLGYSPLEVGLAFLPATLTLGVLSLGLSAKLVMQFGIKKPLVTGLTLFVAGLLLFARVPVDGSYVIDVLPSMLLLGLGGGISFNPMLLAAMGDVEPSESGLASGVVNTSQMMGGALGLAILASLAASRTDHLRASGDAPRAALAGGYQAAFVVGAAFAAAAAALGAVFFRAHVEVPGYGDEAVAAPAGADSD